MSMSRLARVQPLEFRATDWVTTQRATLERWWCEGKGQGEGGKGKGRREGRERVGGEEVQIIFSELCILIEQSFQLCSR